MKAIFSSAYVLSVFALSIGLSQTAKADVAIPAEIASPEAAVAAADELAVMQAAQIVMLETEIKYYQLLKLSFEGSRKVSDLFESDVASAGSGTAATGVTVAANYKLVQRWLSGAQPSVALVKEVWSATRGDIGRVRSTARQIYAALKRQGRLMSIPAKVASTAALGMFIYVEYETFWVINMSEAQYNTVIAGLDQAISALQAKQHACADGHKPFGLN